MGKKRSFILANGDGEDGGFEKTREGTVRCWHEGSDENMAYKIVRFGGLS
jgi:hypothetical protein